MVRELVRELGEAAVNDIANRCRHYTGIALEEQCAAGVLYSSVRGPERGMGAYPCFKDNDCAERCQLASFLSEEEASEREQRMNEAVVAMLTELAEGKTCVECHQPITSRKQVGRCVYGSPCGHRQYQGRV